MNSARVRQIFDFNWKFCLGDIKNGQVIDLDDKNWRNLHLPHDFSIEGTYDEKNISGIKGGFLPTGIAWYRKSFEVAKEWLGKKVFIEFDGIYMNSDVWINGNHLGHRPYGYIGFEYEITPYLNKGTNLIAVRADHEKAPSGRWYTGSGIYRRTWLSIKNPVYVEHWGTYVTTPEVTEDMAKISIETKVKNDVSISKSITLVSKVKDADDRETCFTKIGQIIPGSESVSIKQDMVIKSPKLWSPDTPYIYRLETYIMENESILDNCTTPFGLRYFDFNSQTGFSLNGKPLKFQGVCEHHDAGPVGAAIPEKVLERRLKLLKEMGCNAIRTAHTPLAPEFYDMCDRIGIMVMDEVFDGWEATKAPYDYGLYFEKWWEKDLGDFLKRDRNHPCIIMWSIGNEVKQMKTATTRKLVDFIHKHEPTRPVTCGVQHKTQNSDDNRALLDIAGYNGGGGAAFIFEKDHQNHPERVCVATEIPHTYHTRGIYRTQTWWRDKNKERIELENLTEKEIFFDGALEYNSSYDNAGVRISARDSWRQTRTLPYLTGEFRWTGFDYMGESFGWPARSGNNGILDLCGFKKDHYYLYQSQWTTEPMVHLLPHWTHPGKEGVVIPVWVYTNCDSAELFLNGRSLGEKPMTGNIYIQWDVPYAPGELKAAAKKNGRIEAFKIFKTASEPVKIKLSADNQNMLSDAKDVSHVTFEIMDRDNNLVPHADDTVVFRAFGPVNNLGMDNGDPLDLTPVKADYRKAFYGMGLGIFQSTFEQGEIELVAGGILGERIFNETAQVSIAVNRIMLRGQLPQRKFHIYYTTDKTLPDQDSKPYKKSFILKKSSSVKAAVYENGQLVMTLDAEFKKGKKPKIIDLTHGNKIHDITKGPFAKEIIGIWEGNGEQYIFGQDGTVSNVKKDGSKKQGRWWYDYPKDPFEAPDYAGMGEIVWNDNSGAFVMDLKSQEARQLNIRYIYDCTILNKK